MTTTTDPPASLAAALAALQAELPAVTKTKTAKVQGKTRDGRPFDYTYKYADLADVSATVMPLMGKHGLAFTCQPTMRENGQFGLAYQLLHASGELIDGWYPLDASMTPQQIGGHITYARRYCLCAVTGIAAEEDTDGQHIDAPAQRKPRTAPPERAAGNLPRNSDGSTSRSRATDAELAAAGQMTDAQIREHGKLERDTKGTGPQGTRRLTGTPPDDPFYDAPPPAALRAARPAGKPVAVIHQYFTGYGYTDSPEDRAARLKRLSAIAGRPITSANDLTAAEGIKVIRLLEKCPDIAALDEALSVMAGEDIA